MMASMRSAMAPALVIAIALGTIVIDARPAHADEPASNDDRALALTLFKRGRELMDAGEVDAACRSFEESQRLDPGGGTLLNLAVCHEQQGKTATAWGEYAEGLAQARRDARSDRIDLARDRMAALEPKLVRLQINVVGGAESVVKILRDGRPMPREAWGVAVPIDPGEHRIEVFLDGVPVHAVTTVVASEPGGTTTATIDLQGITRTTTPASSTPARKEESQASAKPPTTASTGWRRTLGWSLALGSVVTVGAATYFGLRAFSERSSSDEQCLGGRCSAAGVLANDNAKTAADLSTGGFVLGGALILTSVYLLVTSPSSPRHD